MNAKELIAVLQQLPSDQEIASEDENGLMIEIAIGNHAATDERYPGREFFVLHFGHTQT